MQHDRWEYRIWPEEAGAFISALENIADQELPREVRTDHYLLTGDEHLLPKIRGGALFEIKELLETKHGCERWMPAISEPFPVSSADLQGLLGASADMPTAQALIEAAQSSLTILSVQKQRRRFEVGDSAGEITLVNTGNIRVPTVAIETPTLDACVELTEALGLADHDNTDYGSFLRSLTRP